MFIMPLMFALVITTSGNNRKDLLNEIGYVLFGINSCVCLPRSSENEIEVTSAYTDNFESESADSTDSDGSSSIFIRLEDVALDTYNLVHSANLQLFSENLPDITS